jgi:hypothetical protein
VLDGLSVVDLVHHPRVRAPVLVRRAGLPMSRGSRLALAAFVLAAVSMPASALAAPDAEARALAAEAYQRGVAAHDRGDLAASAKELALADAIAPNPTALRAALDAAVDADDPALGAELLERSTRAPLDGPLAQSAEAARKKLGGRAGRVRVACPEGAACLATLDGAPMGIPAPSWTRTGQHTVVVQVDGASQTKLVTVGAEEIVVVAPTARAPDEPRTPIVSPPAPSPAETAQAAPPPPRQDVKVPSTPSTQAGLPRTVVLVSGTLTIAVGALALLWATKTGNTHQDFVSSGCPSFAFPGCTELKSDGESQQTTTNLLLAVTGGLALTTAVVGVFLTDWTLPRKAAAPRSAAFAAPIAGGAAGGWSGRF